MTRIYRGDIMGHAHAQPAYAAFRKTLVAVMEEIQQGTFAYKWEAEQEAGYPVFTRLHEKAQAHPIIRLTL